MSAAPAPDEVDDAELRRLSDRAVVHVLNASGTDSGTRTGWLMISTILIEAVEVITTSPGRNDVIVKVTTADGVVGWGDATLNGRELAVAAYLSEHLVPVLVGRTPRASPTRGSTCTGGCTGAEVRCRPRPSAPSTPFYGTSPRLAAALHLDLVVPNFGIQEFMGYPEVTHEVFRVGYADDGQGMLDLDESPGLGVEVDEDAARTHPYDARYLPVARLRDGSMHDW